MAPKPDGGAGSGWDPSQAASDSSGGSASSSLWDLNGLDKTPITVKYADAVNAKRVAGGRLDPYDREAQVTADSTAKIGLPTDLVKQPIVLYGSDPKAYLAFQQKLFAAGFYGSTSAKSIPWGSDPTGSTYDAWKRVLAAAQQAQAAGLSVTPDQILDQGVKEHTAATAGGVSKAPLVVQTTDPAVLRGLVQQAAQQALGKNLSKAEVDAFVASFHEQEAAYSKKAYAANQDETGATFNLTQPNANAQADEFVQNNHPTEAGGNRLADYVGVIHQLLGG